MPQKFYVNPLTGNSTNPGSQQAPFKTITQALKIATPDTIIQLTDGNYSVTSGEVFPLTIPFGVKVIGNEANKGSNILIEGSGNYLSRTFAGQNVTFVMLDGSELRGVTVTNPASRGSGIWSESTTPTIANCTFKNCKREGVFATGDANPVVQGNVFTENAANGIAIAKNSKGQIQDNTCIKTGFGIAISDTASPTLLNNKFTENRSGIVVSGSARPVLRNNISENNTDDGLTVIAAALPDLGSTSSSGGNIFRNNGKFDLQNASSNKLISVGNQIDPSKVSGNIEFASTPIPTPTPVPTPTPTPIPVPTPTPVPVPTPTPTPTPIPTPTPVPTPTPTPKPTPVPVPLPIPIPIPIPTPTPDPEPEIEPDPEPTPTPTPVPVPTPTPTPKPTPTPTPAPIDLTDIANHWAAAFIRELVRQGIVNGFPDRTFRPNATMTRAQYAALIVKAFAPSSKRAATQFKDVAANFWAAKVIQQAYQGQFLSGFPDNTFRPNQNIQRVQVLVSLVNGLGLGTASNVANAIKIFDDQAKIPDYAKDEIAKAIDKRIIVNYPNLKQLNPTRDATRAEVAVMVYQALVDAGRVAAIDSQYIVNG
ncbi:parallel beta-helix repeat (two copies) [Nostoc piscinale CENA21]|uniref:Parallel beta-helix repeat (Two copies) n=1 Tax=Nostoc piscinale CENA21 TaxID=224013 RepID=A0A0M4SWT2_9NOSO|nr:DUF1565 domain-containing protein [Nostoc piscinale]ALF53259.1 parallel beta-helix repeat (two copies) [Nostoc piscinale CENA21]